MDRCMEMSYTQICGILTESTPRRIRNLDFEQLCDDAGTDPIRLENMLYERFGMSWEDMCISLRKHKVCL